MSFLGLNQKKLLYGNILPNLKILNKNIQKLYPKVI